MTSFEINLLVIHSYSLLWFLSSPKNDKVAKKRVIFLFHFASKKGTSWLNEWEKEDANIEQLPYELLIVNVSTIGIHFLTGILLTIGFVISVWI